MLYKLPLTITTLSPVVFSENSGDNVMTGSADYLSGAALRGALAGMYIRNTQVAQAEKDKDFYDCFLSDKLHFLPGYPLCADGGTAYPLPLSLYTTKSKDRLLDLTCSEIEPSLKGVKGFGVCSDGSVKRVAVKKNINLHMSRSTAEERIVGSSKAGTIYNYEYVEAGQMFQAAVVGSKEDLEQFKKTASGKLRLTTGSTLYLGRSKHTQYGKCSVKLGDIAEAYVKGGSLGNKLYLCAHSDFLPLDSSFSTVDEALSGVLNDISAETGSAVTLGKCFAAVDEQEGFVGVWGVKRKVQRSLKAGTVIELVKESGWTDSDIEAVQAAAFKGFGRRTSEGFGCFRLWKPVQFKGNCALMADAVKHVEKPKVFGKEVKDTVSKVIDGIILERLQQLAWEDIEKRFRHGGLGKHALARIENTISEKKDSFQLKTAVLDSIRDYSAFKVNLEDAKVDNVSLYEIFEDPKKSPYVSVWNTRVADEKLRAMAKDIGIKLPGSDDNKIYYEFWLWYCRIARKNAGKKGGVL